MLSGGSSGALREQPGQEQRRSLFFQTLLSAAGSMGRVESHTPSYDPLCDSDGVLQCLHPLSLKNSVGENWPYHLPLFLTLSLSFLICKASQGC